MITRREFLAGSVALAVARRRTRKRPATKPVFVNDIHSQLNFTRVEKILQPQSVEEVQRIIRTARKERDVISVSGGRHAMGGQQFGTDTLLIDIRSMNRVLHLDREHGIVEVEAGVQWPGLIKGYVALQKTDQQPWGIAQKQTGADRLTISGTISANAHGRGLQMKPFISDVESLVLVDGSGAVRNCSRTENPELFRLAHGGYGLFGIITSARLRLVPRQKVERVVEMQMIEDLMTNFEKRIADGFLYGDFQFSIDRDADDFLRRGVFSCYRPVAMETPISDTQKQLSEQDWKQLLYLAHADKQKAFDRYSEYYVSTNGQVYWSDTHQLSIYPDNYHREIDQKRRVQFPATELIGEIDVPRAMLKDFFDEAREDFRKNNIELIYGTVRLIEQDDESFLPWAKQPYACTIFNLHTVHTPDGVRKSRDAFRRLIDMAGRRGGSFYLTYHRDATRAQIENCYPQFVEFLRAKKKYDPEERFQSEWYRDYKSVFADNL
jgi:FAD/FMN-containing dehydrogenase